MIATSLPIDPRHFQMLSVRFPVVHLLEVYPGCLVPVNVVSKLFSGSDSVYHRNDSILLLFRRSDLYFIGPRWRLGLLDRLILRR